MTQRQKELDIGWNYGKMIGNDHRHVKCNYCAKQMHGGVTRLKEHLAGVSGDVAPCREVPKEVREEIKKHVQSKRKDKQAAKFEKQRVQQELMEVPRGANTDEDEEDEEDVENVELRRAMKASRQTFMEEQTYGSSQRFGPGLGEGVSNQRFGPGLGEGVSSQRFGPGLGEGVSNQRFGPGLREGVSREAARSRSFRIPGTIDPFMQKKQGRSQTNLKAAMKGIKDAKKHIGRAISKFFFYNHISHNVASSPYYEPMIDAIADVGRGVPPPTPWEISHTYLNNEVDEIKVYVESYGQHWDEYGCTLMCDGWSTQNRRKIINFLVYSTYGTVFLKSVDATDQFQNADYICSLMDDMVQIIGESRVVQVITDNGSNYKKAGQQLMLTRKHLYWTPCAAHCIDLIFHDMSKDDDVKNIILQCQQLTGFIYNHGWVLSLMRRETQNKELIRPAITRFATHFIALESIYLHRDDLRRMITAREWVEKLPRLNTKDKKNADDVYRMIYSDKFWKDIASIIVVFEPLVKVLRLVDSDDKADMGYLYEAMDRAKEAIKKNVGKGYKKWWGIIDTRWDRQLHQDIHAAGYFLNPRFQYSSNATVDNEVLSGFKHVVERMEPDVMKQLDIQREVELYRMKVGVFYSEKARIAANKYTPVSAVEQLQIMASKRQYKEAAAQLEAVNQLIGHFEAYIDVPKINELKEKFKNIKKILKSHVFSDFSSLGTGKETEESNLLQQLSDACLVVDALEPSVREELVKNFCSKELTSYRQIFEGAELAKLDKTERRYAWIKRRLRTNEEIWKIFPPAWHVDYLLCIQFCKLTRTQIVDILNNLKEKPDVGTLLMALQRTLEFEEELAEKFGGGNLNSRNTEFGSDLEATDEEENNNQIVSDIRKKYEKKFAAQRGGNEHEKDKHKDLLAAGAGFNFRGIISSCFEAHLAVYVELEEKTLMEHLEKLVQEETWETEEGSQTNILSSSMQVFLIIRRSLKRCSALTKNQTLFSLFEVFKRILKAYATKLYSRLPKGGTGIVAAATGTDGQIKTSDRDERMICYIVNTAEYCHQTSGELAENVSKIIDSQFADRVDMSDVQDEFSSVITKALLTLVNGLETKFDAEMIAMTRVPWATLESVGDQSEYVNGINSILSSSIPVLGSLLSPTYFQFFLDKLAASLGPRFYLNIYKCKHISETGAQQMLLDTQAVKTILLDIPALGKKTTVAASYSKFVSREMSKAEALLKVILSPVDSVGNTYRALLPEGTPLEFQRILDLKGLKKADQQAIMDDFSKHSPGIRHPSVAPAVVVHSAPPTPPTASTVTTTSSTASNVGSGAGAGAAAAITMSREDVLTRAAALGRGAATTGFKRFLALTEAAKDRKDGPFRKLFNP